MGLGGIVPMGMMSSGDSDEPRTMMSLMSVVRPARYDAMPGAFDPPAAVLAYWEREPRRRSRSMTSTRFSLMPSERARL